MHQQWTIRSFNSALFNRSFLNIIDAQMSGTMQVSFYSSGEFSFISIGSSFRFEPSFVISFIGTCGRLWCDVTGCVWARNQPGKTFSRCSWHNNLSQKLKLEATTIPAAYLFHFRQCTYQKPVVLIRIGPIQSLEIPCINFLSTGKTTSISTMRDPAWTNWLWHRSPRLTNLTVFKIEH